MKCWQARTSLAYGILNTVSDDSARPEGASRHTTAHTLGSHEPTTDHTLQVCMNGFG